tara:strand:- start:199 stop:1029 length:831 start_codon:yes stop_codon:yes gene_type:complete
MDMPLIHSACPLLMLLCKYSVTHSKVCITGEGGDELFLGYNRHIVDFKDKLYQFLRRTKDTPLESLYSLLSVLSHSFPIDPGLNPQNGPAIKHTKAILPEMPMDLTYRSEVANKSTEHFSKVLAADQTSYLQSLLERQDKMSSAMSVESRVPFVNHKLFEMVNAQPYGSKIEEKNTKIVLKNILKEEFGEDFLTRPKNGFVLPIAKWLRGNSRMNQFLDFITDKTFRERGYYDNRQVERMLKEHLTSKADNYKILLSLINFEIWHRLFIDKTLSAK